MERRHGSDEGGHLVPAGPLIVLEQLIAAFYEDGILHDDLGKS